VILDKFDLHYIGKKNLIKSNNSNN
jgi:hypothetical protein